MRFSGNRRNSSQNWGEPRKAAPNQTFYKCCLITPTLEVVGSNPVSRTIIGPNIDTMCRCLVRFFLPGKPPTTRLSALSGCICDAIRHDRAPFRMFSPETSSLPGKATVSNGHNRFNEKARDEDQSVPTTGCYRICRYSVSVISVPFLNRKTSRPSS